MWVVPITIRYGLTLDRHDKMRELHCIDLRELCSVAPGIVQTESDSERNTF